MYIYIFVLGKYYKVTSEISSDIIFCSRIGKFLIVFYKFIKIYSLLCPSVIVSFSNNRISLFPPYLKLFAAIRLFISLLTKIIFK